MKHIVLTIFLVVVTTAAFESGLLLDYTKDIIADASRADRGGDDVVHVGKDIIAIADGVSGWMSDNVIPRTQASELIGLVKKYRKQNPSIYLTHPKQLLIDCSKGCKQTGTSVFLILTMDPITPTLHSTYMGDSGYLLLRRKSHLGKYKKIFRSPEKRQGFNFPLQVGIDGNDPYLAAEYSHQVQEGDIVIAGSDGLFDNIFEKQILKILNQHRDKSLASIAKLINSQAHQQSIDKQYLSPFCVEAKEHGQTCVGGKEDDITIIVAQVVRKY